jgi:hypothetical protein
MVTRVSAALTSSRVERIWRVGYDAADIAVLEQSPPRKRARVVAAAVRAMGTEACDRDESEPASQPGDAPDEPMR